MNSLASNIVMHLAESTIDSEGFKGGTRGTPIMPRDAVSRTANVERNGGHKWVKLSRAITGPRGLSFRVALNRDAITSGSKFRFHLHS